MSDQEEPSSLSRPSASIVAGRHIRPRLDERLQICRQILMNRLADHLDEVFAQVDDTLFDCAEKAENNQVQALFFDSMRDLRRQRGQIERLYHQLIARRFDAPLDVSLPMALDAARMALVPDEVYEETLWVNDMVGKAEARCAQVLPVLERRLATLQADRMGAGPGPFSPRAIAESFREALAAEPRPPRIKHVLYTLFDRYVMEELEPLYGALNQSLVEAGVLPDLKHVAGSPGGPSRPGRATPSAHPHALMPRDDAPDDLLDHLASLLAQCRQQDRDIVLPGHAHSIARLTPAHAASTYSQAELLDTLDRLQRDAARELSPRLDQPQPVDGFKRSLGEHLERDTDTDRPRGLENRQADVIDLIGMLFDFILDDDGLPDRCKTVLSHLHTPYLRLALQDDALFTEPTHPARRLLDAMAQAGTLYGDAPDLVARMKATVTQIIQDEASDASLYVRLLADFESGVAVIAHRVALRERRAVEAVKGRDRLQEARRAAAGCLEDILKTHPCGAEVRAFLQTAWADVLVFAQLRQGEQGDAWRQAAQAARDLAWIDGPLGEADEARARTLRPRLFECLREGLEALGHHHEDDIRRQLQALREKPGAPVSPPPGESSAAVVADHPAPWHDSPVGVGSDTLTPEAERLMETLKTVEFGTWFEFTDEHPARVLKLSWFSPTSRNCMFVDQAGQRVAVKSVERLASDMTSGRVRRLPERRETPLMDRALEAILRALRRLAGRGRVPS